MARPPELAFASTRKLTPAEFADWLAARPESDLHRYELLGGRVVMTPPAGHPHGYIESKLAVLLGSFVEARELGVCLGSSQGFAFPSGDTVEPDCSFVSAARWQAMPRPRDGEFLRVVPDLVVEILSGSTAGRDRVRKRRIYERNGVREYWLVDPGRRTILVLTRHAGKFDTGTTYTGTAIVRSTLLPGIAFTAERIFPSSRPG
jgi:Uma2 family endonuclease